MTTKHTPKPWKRSGNLIQTDYAATYGTVATIHDMPNNWETNANAALIVSSPDLLEACETIIGILESEKRGPWGDSSHIMRFCRNENTPKAFGAIRAAIAKARGE